MKPFVKRSLAASALTLSLITSMANAGPWEDGYEAYQRKDYVTAVQLWRIVANEGKGIFYAKNRLGMHDRQQIETRTVDKFDFE